MEDQKLSSAAQLIGPLILTRPAPRNINILENLISDKGLADDVNVICNELCMDIDDIKKRDEKYFENEYKDKNIIQARIKAYEQKRLYNLSNILKKWKIIWDIQNKNKNKTGSNFSNNACDTINSSNLSSKIKLRS
jgi:hypothetical protein